MIGHTYLVWCWGYKYKVKVTRSESDGFYGTYNTFQINKKNAIEPSIRKDDTLEGLFPWSEISKIIRVK